MSGMLPADDQDLSFSLPFPDQNDWLSPAEIKPSPRVVLIAVMVSLAIHAMIFQWSIPPYRHEPRVDPVKPIHITLDYAAQSTARPAVPVDDSVSKILSEPVTEITAVTEQEVVDIAEPEILPRQIVQQDLETIIVQQNKYRDDYLPSTNSASAPGSFDDSSEVQHFNNVFDSRLRARLQANQVRTVSQKLSGPTTVTDVYDNTLVELDNGACMTATSTAIGQPTDWYITNCSGRASESEEIMRRVNSEVKRRR